MKAIILAGGEGTRLRPLTYTTPKAMVPILGRPYLEHMLVYLRRNGVTEIALALGHHPEPIQRYFGDGSHWGVRLDMVVEPQPLGSGGAIKQFAPGLARPFFAVNGDVLTDFDLTSMRRQHEQTDAALSIALMEVKDPSAFGVAALDADGRIINFVEKPPAGAAPSNWANAGIWLFEPRVLDRIPAGRRSMVEMELFPELISAGERVQAYRGHGFWVDIGTPERYLAAQLRLLEEPGLRELPLVSWPGTPFLSAETEPNVESAPRVATDASIEGPVLFGTGVTVESGAVIRGPVAIGAGCRIGPRAFLERSVLWEACTIAANGRVSESVLAEEVVVGVRAGLLRVIAGRAASFEVGITAADERVEPETAWCGPGETNV